MADDRIICMNLGSQHVAGAVFTKTPDGGLALRQFQRADLVGDPSVEEGLGQTKMALTEVAGGLKAKGVHSEVVISGQPVFIRFVKLPPLDVDQVDQIVEFEAQQQVPFPINEVVWNYQLMGDPEELEVEVMLAAIKSDELEEIDQAVRGAGVKNQGVGVAPIALYNAFRFNYADLEGTTVIIDIGARTTNLIYVEGNKVFIRTIKIGGADITKAIAKEFDVSFPDAEQRKIADGFVALGGPYADHDDPVIAGISKVIRNSLTRLHSEVMRTTNFFRSQQGGSAPELALVCGATAALPFIREFFAEKLNIPIDYFNALRNVTVAGTVDREAISAQAHTLGELVGAALGASGKAPAQMELAPASVRAAKEFAKRKPALILSTLALAAMLAALGFWHQKAAAIAVEKSASLESTEKELSDHSVAIGELKAQLEKMETEKQPYIQAVTDRAYWTGLYNDLSQRMSSDLMWITRLEPLAEGLPVMDEGAVTDQPGIIEPTAAAADSAPKMIDTIQITGLYRGGSYKVVTDYLEALRESPYFDLKDKSLSELLEGDAGGGVSRYAYSWKMTLPLPENIRIRYTK